MFPVAGSVVDALHALLMVAWVAGLPLLFWHRFPRASRTYALYAVVFVAINQVSRLFLGECVLTTLARKLWSYGLPAGATPDEWFTVRLARAVFHASPSHGAITVLSEILVLITAIGVLLSLHRGSGARVLRRRHP
jgi:hypothetical protein